MENTRPKTAVTEDPAEFVRKNAPSLASQYDEMWSKVMEILKNELTDVIIDTWLRDVHIVYLTDRSAVLFIPNTFHRDVVSKRYTGIIEEALSSVCAKEMTVDFLKDSNGLYEVPQLAPAAPEKHGGQDYEYTFESFIVGNSNRFAHAAAISVATQPGSNSYNPLFIYGGSGLGKTHLLYAIMEEYKRKFPEKKVLYLRGDDFTNDLIQSIQQSRMVDFRSKYRYADMLLVDDIQFIAGRESTQEEFFHTFNNLYEYKKQIVLTSDRPPKDISTLEDRLRTRFEWGLLADIQPPDFETRMAIIKRKADVIGILMPDDVTTMIANNIKTNIRQLEGVVKRLKAYNQLTGIEINIQTAEPIISDFTGEIKKKITPELIIDRVAKFYDITPSDIKGKKRSANIAFARQVCIYIMTTLTDMSTVAIGAAIGGKHHSTVLYSRDLIEEEIKKDPVFSQNVNDLINDISGN